MATFIETITFGAAAFQLELDPVAGSSCANLKVRRQINASANGDPGGWLSCFSDPRIDIRRNSNVEKIRRAMKLPPDQVGLILDLVDRYERANTASADAEQKKKSGFKLHIRGKNMAAMTALEIEDETPFAAIQWALNIPAADLPEEAIILVPKSMDNLAFLDVDYHNLPFDQRPDERDLDAMMNAILPREAFGFASHGRGLKMIFVRQDGLPARVLAECAAAYTQLNDPRCTTEVKPDCRHPAMPRGEQKCGTVRELIPDETIAILGCFNSFACPPDIAEKFRIEDGWQVGQRYGHEKCPIDPTHVSGSSTP